MHPGGFRAGPEKFFLNIFAPGGGAKNGGKCDGCVTAPKRDAGAGKPDQRILFHDKRLWRRARISGPAIIIPDFIPGAQRARSRAGRIDAKLFGTFGARHEIGPRHDLPARLAKANLLPP